MTLQICGKCIGGEVSRWCSAAASVENYAIKRNQAHLPRRALSADLRRLADHLRVLFAVRGPDF
jgi:hypothetical protein